MAHVQDIHNTFIRQEGDRCPPPVAWYRTKESVSVGSLVIFRHFLFSFGMERTGRNSS